MPKIYLGVDKLVSDIAAKATGTQDAGVLIKTGSKPLNVPKRRGF